MSNLNGITFIRTRFGTQAVLNFLLFVSLFACISGSYAQESAIELISSGVNAFFGANFEEAIRDMQTALAKDSLMDDEVYLAHLYLAFSLSRQSADSQQVYQHYVEAIKANPRAVLDDSRTPPDLYRNFTRVRRSLLAEFTVLTDPDDATAILLNRKDGRLIPKATPAVFANLLEGNYQLVVSKQGYLDKSLQVVIKPMTADTLNIRLQKEKKSFLTQWYTWTGGLVVATAVAILARSGKEEGSPGTSAELPAPPARP